MHIWQSILLVLISIYSLIAFLKGYDQSKRKDNPYGLSYFFNPIGSFVWADAVIFGAFFFLISLLSLILQDFIFFLLVFTVFWTVRSVGEQIYWFLEQFAVAHRNPPHTLWMHRWFPRDSVWIANQIVNQCISVIGIIASAYLFSLWLF